MMEDVESKVEPILDQIVRSTDIVSFNQLCRVCASSKDHVIGLYSEESKSNGLADKLNRYLPVEVSENDSLPQQCCWNCASAVLAWHELYLLSAQSEGRLRELQRELQDMVAIKEPLNEDFASDLGDDGLSEIAEDVVEVSNSLTEEDISTITFIENHDMDENHQLTAHDTITRSEITFNETRQSTISKKRKRTRKEITYSIFCEVCNLGYTRFADMLKHKRLKHPMVLEEPELKNENDCELCSKKYKSTLELKRHLREIHRQSIPRRRRRQEDIVAEHFCEVCDKGFTRKFDMQKHHAQKHPEQSLKDAVEPSKRKKSSELLKKCKVINEEGVITHYKCETCQKSFKQSYNFIRHQSVHTGIKAYVCHKCGKEFRVSSGLVRHIKQYHQRIRKYGCDVCGKMFAAKSSWKNHSRVHTGDRPFICEVCGKSFKQQATLHSHKLFHTNNFKYSCNFCGKKFRRSGDLKVHVWVHTGHKPYNCDMCSAAFRLPQDLKKHKVIHKRIDGYKCIKCGACFPQERFLKSHLLNQHYENKSTKNTIISNILI